MLKIYFKSPFTIERLRSGPSGPPILTDLHTDFIWQAIRRGLLRDCSVQQRIWVSGDKPATIPYSLSTKTRLQDFSITFHPAAALAPKGEEVQMYFSGLSGFSNISTKLVWYHL